MLYKYYKLTMKVELKCCSCKKNIPNDSVIYMCVDNTFCSLSCGDKHLRYIINFDPDFNYPELWNNLSDKNVYLIEVDYLHSPRMNSNHKLYRKNLYPKILEYKEKENVFITCKKFYNFSLHLFSFQTPIL